jgi:hypothetical protein
MCGGHGYSEGAVANMAKRRHPFLVFLVLMSGYTMVQTLEAAESVKSALAARNAIPDDADDAVKEAADYTVYAAEQVYTEAMVVHVSELPPATQRNGPECSKRRRTDEEIADNTNRKANKDEKAKEALIESMREIVQHQSPATKEGKSILRIVAMIAGALPCNVRLLSPPRYTSPACDAPLLSVCQSLTRWPVGCDL